MKRLLLTLALAAPLAAQQPSSPQIILSVFGGIISGAPLWEVNRQPLLVLPTQNLTVQVYDTIRVSRRLGSGLVAGVSGTYFTSRNVGLLGEISLLGLATEDQCTLVSEDVADDPVYRRNNQVCDDINQRSGSASAVGFFFGVLLRANPSPVMPYLRTQVGFTTRQSSLTELSGRIVTPTAVTRGIYLDQGGGSLDPAVAVGAGLMVQVSPGYQFRLEARDHVIAVREVTGPTTLANLGAPPVSSRFIHSFALTVHVDIVLERRRGRRY